MSVDLQFVVSLLAAFGLGSVVTAVIQDRLNAQRDKAKRNFEEKKEAYLGLLRALHDAAVRPSNEASKEFAYWQLRCELIASNEIGAAIQKIVDTNDDRARRAVAYDELKRLLRNDLGLAGSKIPSS